MVCNGEKRDKKKLTPYGKTNHVMMHRTRAVPTKPKTQARQAEKINKILIEQSCKEL